ncbi:VanW family protein [Solibacillus isronensis]|uniref:VanW family protein n=1 Tax=Solibacillus isronensis TaxID=412383 RepID=UPI0009A7F674|nr:VanW family protein [Solibacillus isronensis]
MKIIFRSIIPSTLAAVLLSIWIPNFIASSIASADNNAVGSTIGGIETGDLKGEELKAILTEAVNDWYAQNLTVTGGGTSIEVSSSTFQFDIESTVANYENQVHKSWFAFWEETPTVHLPLTVFPSETVKNEISNVSSWDTEATYSSVELNAAYLKTAPVEAVVTDLTVLETDRISLSIEPMPEGAMGINELVIALHETVIEPQMVFSMIEKLGDTINLANREAINFVASSLYNAALNSNAEIVERHSQNTIPSYLKPGLEAKVDLLANEDLKFVNASSHPIVLKLTMEEGNLKTEVYTPAKETEVDITVSRDEEIQPRTITRYSADLAIGQNEQIQEGAKGLRVSVYRTAFDEQKLVSRDYYPPVDRIIVKSSRKPVVQPSSESLNNDPAYQVDLDGDGFPNADTTNGNGETNDSQNTGSTTSSSGTQNKNSDASNNSAEGDAEEDLPPGSYYDKGGNLITPK